MRQFRNEVFVLSCLVLFVWRIVRILSARVAGLVPRFYLDLLGVRVAGLVPRVARIFSAGVAGLAPRFTWIF